MSIQHFQCVGVPFYHTAALLGKHQETISGYFLCQFKVISSCGTTNMKEEFFSYCVCYSDSLLNLYWCEDDTLKSIFSSFLTDVTALCHASVEDLGDVHQGTGLLTILPSSGIAVTKISDCRHFQYHAQPS
jgi:hypothetical protein